MDFEQIKRKLLSHLEKQLEPEEMSKALAVNEILEKAVYPVGTIRTWKGKKYIKTAPGKWQRKYESAGRGANQAIKNLMKKIEDAGTPEELYQLIMQNQSRFRDENGRMLPEVQQLHDLVQKRQEKVEGDSKTVIADGDYTAESSYFQKKPGASTSPIISHPKKKASNKKPNEEEILNARLAFARLNGILEKGHEVTIEHPDLGEIWVLAGETGKKGYGLKHIIEQRYTKDGKSAEDIAAMIPLVLQAASGGEITRKNDKSIELSKNGIVAIVANQMFDKEKKWILTGFDSWDKKEEATDAIKTVIAVGSYAPEFSYFRKQVGTVISSINSIPQSSGKSTGIDSIKAKYNASKSVDGDEDEIYVGGETITGRWKLVEAEAPSASHDEKSFQKTKGFPTAKDGGTVNDRDYEHDKAAQEAVIDMAGSYDGRALSFDSPVVVTKDGVVISGNNRTMSSKIAARNGTDTKYIDALKKRAKKFGFTAEDVDGFKNPRVVFETDPKEEYSTEQFAKFNRSGKKAMDPIESAVKVSKTIKPQTIEDVAGQISEFDTLGELYADKKALRKVFNSFIDGGLIQKTDLPAYFTDSGITGAGKEFLETVMIGSVIDEGNIRQLNSEGTKSIRQKLVRAITPLIENKGMKGYSINRELNDAVRISVQVAKNKEKFPNVEEFSKQQDMFEKLDPVAVELAKRMEGTQKEFASFMSSMNGGLRPSANGEVDIFLGEVESKEQIVSRMLGIKKSVQMIMAKSLSLLDRVRIALGGA